MSAVKRVFTHSAIRSAIRKPFVPNDDGYREYLKRSVFELNGTQWGELSEPVVLDGDFEIEWEGVIADTGTLQAILGKLTSTTDRLFFGINETGNLRFNSPGYGSYLFESAATVQYGKVNKLVARYVGSQLTMWVNNASSTDSKVLGSLRFDLIFKHLSGNLSEGAPLGLKIWTNGDRNTGELILNVPFDESGSDYQRNHAVPLGENLSSASGIYQKSESILVVPTSASLTGGRKYLVRFYVKNNDSNPGIEFADFDFNGFITPYYQGWIEFLSTPQSSYTADLLVKGGASNAAVSDVSICEWSGVVLQSALPDDWMQLERKRWWDYWREVGSESNILEIAS